jgi:hypothetical protein
VSAKENNWKGTKKGKGKRKARKENKIRKNGYADKFFEHITEIILDGYVKR